MILALRTDGPVSVWFILDPQTGDVIKPWEWQSGRDLADGLLGRLAYAIRETAPEAKDAPQAFGLLTGIIVFSGPGSFTSLRIGHATVNALADGFGIPVVGVMGEAWVKQGFEALKTTQAGVPALPVYGAEPNVKPLQA